MTLRTLLLLGVSLVLLSGPANPQAAPADPLEDPFEGWAPEQVGKHTRQAKRCIVPAFREWISASKDIIHRCQRCQGRTTVIVRGIGRNAPDVVISCPMCAATGMCISKSNFYKVYWNYYSPRFKADLQRRQRVDATYEAGKQNPGRAIEFDGWTKKKIIVLGNYAEVHFELRFQSQKSDQVQQWIQVGDKWWIFHEEADADFVHWEYPEEEEPEEGGDPEAKPPVDPAKPPQRRPPAKPNTEDWAKVFALDKPKVRRVDGNAHRVSGTVTNLTKDRHFRFVIVEVAFFRGEEPLDRITCNIGGDELGPGGYGFYSGIVYMDPPLKFDRTVEKIVSAEDLER